MENQHRQISGYRELDALHVEAMNLIKERCEQVRVVADRLRSHDEYDQRSVALGITKLEEAEMWLCRAVARPGG